MTFHLESELHQPVGRILQRLGMGPLASLQLDEDRLATVHYTATLLDEQQVMVVVPRTGLPRRAIQHQRVANRLLRRADAPHPPGFRAAWCPEIEGTIVIRSVPFGERATLMMEDGRLDPSVVYAAVGRVLAQRQSDHEPAGWADATGFQSMPSFRDVMVRSAGHAECVLRVSAVDPGPAADEVFARFGHALEHATFPEANALTHGGIGAPNLRFSADGELLEIEGWAQCILADPLYEWGALHHMGGDAVDWAAVGAEGLVRDRHRLAVGYFGKVVLDLGTLAALTLSAPEPARADLVMFARHTLERSLQMAPPEWGCQPVPTSPHALWHRIADAVRSIPPPDARDAAFISGAVAAMEMPDWTDRRRSLLANRHLDQLRPRLLAPFEHGVRSDQGHPLILRIQQGVEAAFGGHPPFGFHAGLNIWSHAMRKGEPRDAFEAMRRALVLQWCGQPVDLDELETWWEVVSWRSQGTLTSAEALDLAEDSSDPLDLPRVLGALALDGGPPRGELLSALLSKG